MIVFKNVYKKFTDDYVLNNVNLNINRGEVFVLCGPSGAGKTTLLKTINGLEKIDHGSIVVNGVEINKAKKELMNLRKKIGFVFQSPGLYSNLNIIKNITLAPIKVLKLKQKNAQEQALQLLVKMGIESKALAYPYQLSGGEQQRVAVARALAMKPEILLLDEPTSALDPEMTSEVLNVISELANNGMTMIIVTHEMGFARNIGDRIAFMANGFIKQIDKPYDFFNNQTNEHLKTFLSKVLSHK